jgi:hypothetical protein
MIEPLSIVERRILGTLVEKQKTSKTADAYPLTLNSLTLGCNQKSNRDPVLELSDDVVEETLEGLGRRGLTMKMTGGRAERYRHLLYEVWGVSKVEMAVLAELLLRGPQTVGELRTRASRMDDIADLDALQAILKALIERCYVIALTDLDRRGAMVTHGFHAPDELSAIRAYAAGQATAPAMPESATKPSPILTRLEALEAEVAAMKAELASLKSRLSSSPSLPLPS